ncbi:MAG: hypothetical protein M0Z77_04045 [Thermoplasmatales archaeon]|nr:hypothetical protein [Candidatus Thermoplasmatota archaeon]MCL6002674.1 hypothetical protein [Candidatus Thermoplasmatota archaeon]MDA8054810.1 hypothetical protein [Thermoplasmatales archaeon]
MSVQVGMWERRWVRYLVVYSIVISGFMGLALMGFYLFTTGFNFFNPPLHLPFGFLIGLLIVILDVGGSLAGYFFLTLRGKRRSP